MRHLKSGRKFGRTSAHRKAMFRNLVTALIEKERIRTTLAKAKELRSKVEKTITLGKKGTVHARRCALLRVSQKTVLPKLFGPLAERYADRKGGYTRIIKIGNRLGDDAPMAFIELVDRVEEKPAEAPKKGKDKKEAKPTAATSGKKPAKKKATPSAPKAKKTEDKKAKDSKGTKEKKASSSAKKGSGAKAKTKKK